MIDLSSFPQPFNAAIIGASGGVGRAFVDTLGNHEAIGKLYAFSRTQPDTLAPNVDYFPLDICDEIQIKDAAAHIDTPLHMVIIASGLLHDKDLRPEKCINALDPEIMERVFIINTIGPALIAKHFIPLLPRTGKSVFASLSARVGSISDNRLGGWYSYRVSKAALNMIIKNTAIETARKYKETAVIGLHPGTVDTKLSSPFQGNVKDGQLFHPQQSVEHLLQVLNTVNPKETGKIFAWDGQEIQP